MGKPDSAMVVPKPVKLPSGMHFVFGRADIFQLTVYITGRIYISLMYFYAFLMHKLKIRCICIAPGK